MTCTCYVCGKTVDHTYGSYFCSGPSDLCDTHYGEWTRAFNAATGSSEERYEKACQNIGYIAASKRERDE